MPRKTAPRPPRRRADTTASMRPRPDAAENACKHFSRGILQGWASMRPRPDAAENAPGVVRIRLSTTVRFNEAAARCRGKPVTTNRPVSTPSGFNEAAARCRGKLRITGAIETAAALLQ